MILFFKNVAGFPCQPWSAAGKRDGTGDERWLWPAIAQCLSVVKPPLCFLENVPGLLSGGGLELVLSDLAAMGFDAEWGVLGHDKFGGQHRRERIWIVAYPVRVGTQVSTEGQQPAKQVLGGAGKIGRAHV